MASEHSTDQYQQIKTQEVTGQDESPTFPVLTMLKLKNARHNFLFTPGHTDMDI